MREFNHPYVLNADVHGRNPDVFYVPMKMGPSRQPWALMVYMNLDAFPSHYPDETPSVKTLAALASISEGTCRKALAWMVENGWIYREDVTRWDGGNNAPRYILNAEPFEPLTPAAEEWLALARLDSPAPAPRP